jgi:hypothetical protein
MRSMSLTLAAMAALAAGSMAPAVPAAAQSEAPKPPPIPALDIDPTEQIDVRGWWSNGTELLLIQADGGYRLWKGISRYRAPDDIGRWDRQTYRTLWLETYRGAVHTRDRAHLRREDGILLLTLRDLQPMKPLARPPHTREDTIVGTWSGPPGTLQLRDDGTYSFSVSKGDPKDRQPARLGSHTGTWLLKDGNVVLSQGERVQPVLAALVVPDQDPPQPPTLPAPDGARIVLPGGELKRDPPRPSGAP